MPPRKKIGSACVLWACLLLGFSTNSKAQAAASDSTITEATLEKVMQYAITHQPLIQQSLIDEGITDQLIKSKLADWYPQVNFNYSLQHNFQVATAVIGGNVVKLGVDNVSAGQFSVKQAIFNPDVLLANRTKDDVRLQAKQSTTSNKIDVASEVAKAFYNVLATMQQIKVAEGDIVRIERSLQDAFNQYKAGLADKIDYKRTTIALNNTKATKKSNEALLNARLTYLKSVMGYPENADLNIVYDSLQMEREMILDTLQLPAYNTRIEYQLLETQRKLLQSNVDYKKWSYLPTVALNGGYNLNYQNNTFKKIYTDNYPNSFAALTLSVPIFQGFKRVSNVRQAELELKRTDWDIINLKNAVSAEYAQALASYKSNFANYTSLKENVALAQEVYDVIQLQYKSGIKTYLEVITSETDLQNARINYINALYQLLSSKIDVQKSLGQLNY
ncbi:outer membrane channel protein TolC [soil metagenome]